MNVSQFCIKNYKLHHVGWENPIKFPFFFHLSSLKKKKKIPALKKMFESVCYIVFSPTKKPFQKMRIIRVISKL